MDLIFVCDDLRKSCNLVAVRKIRYRVIRFVFLNQKRKNEFLEPTFILGETNALAEGINNKIQKFNPLTKVQEIKIFSSLGSLIIMPSTSK